MTVLKARIGGAWVPITSPPSDGGGTDEVWVGNDEPADPAIELWYDPDAEAGPLHDSTTMMGAEAGATSIANGTTLQTPMTPWTFHWNGAAWTTSGDGLICPRAGLYRIMAGGAFGSSVTGTIRLIAVTANAINAGITAASGAGANTTGFGFGLNCLGFTRLAAGDIVRLLGRQDSGAALTLNAKMMIDWMAP